MLLNHLRFTNFHKNLKMFHQCSINSKLFCTFASDNYKQRKYGKKILSKDKGNKGSCELIY